ncbi:hypothetical protein IP69_18635 [Bosea sp. AAP35]|uniref:photosynthetic complex putative assembly protein PuhB n=1 Tax=Bosea sp. AAP35 TaxID=1523417 RepID=UPI0006B9EEF5|nr:photosynthetic complex putative assembly protein PuhB [Bosea sp. AAP35]KPF64204.1 hypothetical protein IP69_18635 [Bosea sp. AAP35]
MSHDDFAFEPLPGLPALPPEGETILWQGSPDWRGLAWRAFHLREVTFYFAALVAAQPVLALMQGTAVSATLLPMTFIALAGSVALGVLGMLAWLSARGTVYTITSRRLVMRFGIALPMTINLPFTVIAEAGLRLRRGGRGDLPIGLVPGERVSYIVLWPHARPWRMGRPEPMLRDLPEAERVADILARALAAQAGAAVAKRQPASPASHDQRVPQGMAAAG